MNGHANIVKLLLARKEIEVNRQDKVAIICESNVKRQLFELLTSHTQCSCFVFNLVFNMIK
jgi:K+/H+ antiporter YhaU regulatory subunit KhtT